MEFEAGLKINDEVFFDVEGAAKKPFGQGRVTWTDGKNVRIQPQHELPVGIKITNIRKIG